jgi:hypothetical protein
MKYSTIRIEGSILSADILDKISQEELSGQSGKDFGLPANTKVKDEIARAWADAQDMWRVYKRRIDRLSEGDYGTSETRKFWIIPLLEMLGFDTVYSKSETVNGKGYAISHRANNLDQFPVHIMGFRDSLDKKRTDSGPRMSPHGLVQEYLNLTEHLYAVVTNGVYLRLLRDSSRLIKLSFIEFDLASMMEDQHFADFAIMYRILHASRMPQKTADGGNSLIEQYHQDALDSGSRIRNGLSQAVETSIKMFGEGFLTHPDNKQLRDLVTDNKLNAEEMYECLLKLIYRLLFLLVIEERNLVYPKRCNKEKRQIYYSYYSLASLRSISEKPYLADKRFSDLWIKLKNCFALFDRGNKGEKLDLKPLAGDLFGYKAIGVLNACSLDNKTLLTCLRNLNIFENPVTRQKMRVNYGSLNVEEFGSVYEGLLEKDPVLQIEQGKFTFGFKAGSERSSSGSHYTPDELVQPLIKHSLDHIIFDRLKSSDPISAILSIKVCDVACGSGHILLNAARRIGGEIAKLRSGEEQPSPEPFRQGVRDAINHCIYGVDKNPLAVELCKVALWLEAHDPGKPLSFLDHHIKCGDAVVGLARKNELGSGIANEAFKTLAGDDKDVAKRLRGKNINQIKKEIIDSKYIQVLDKPLTDLAMQCREVHQIDQNTPDDVELVKTVYQDLVSAEEWLNLKTLADIQIAQFFIPKTEEYETSCITHLEYKDFLEGRNKIQGQDVAKAKVISSQKRFFHWFLEFPEIFNQGGFDCILGNPPYLGGKKINQAFGPNYLNYIHYFYPGIGGQADLVTYFLRRVYRLVKNERSLGLIVTNSISEGDTRSGGLAVIEKEKGVINFAMKSIRWPGVANLFISLICIHKKDIAEKYLDNKTVQYINSYFETTKEKYVAKALSSNVNLMFRGVDFGGNGFVITKEEYDELVQQSSDNKEVVSSVLNGQEINSNPSQIPTRYIINFKNYSKEKASGFIGPYKIVKERVKPYRDGVKREAKRDYWWLYAEKRPGLQKKLATVKTCLVTAFTSKYLSFSISDSTYVFTNALNIIALEDFRLFSTLQSNIHEAWVRKYSSTLKNDLRYTPSDCFETFPFPSSKHKEAEDFLAKIGEKYNDYRGELMRLLQLGLTQLYNLFHNQNLSYDIVKQATKQEDVIVSQAFDNILHLRKLNKEMDIAVLEAYGWTDVDLAHEFYEMEYLQENDRTRYTISPQARKEILKRLLQLNHDLYAEEQAAGLNNKKKVTSKKTKAAIKKGQPIPGNLFE